MAGDDIVMVDVTGFSDNAKEGAQLRSSVREVNNRVFANWRVDAVRVGVVCLPGVVVAASHEGGEAVVL